MFLNIFAKNGTVSNNKAGINKARESEKTCAVQAITNLKIQTAMLFMTPIWPITTLDGELERIFAAFMMLGPKNDEPRPAIVKVILKIIREIVLFSTPMIRVARIPMRKENPEISDALFTKNSMENFEYKW